MAIDVATDLRQPSAQQREWERMTRQQKLRAMYQRELEMLETLRVRNAISQAQYEIGLQRLHDHMPQAVH